MPHEVTVNRDNTVLPDGRVYNKGDTATLEDAQFRLIDSGMIGDDGVISEKKSSSSKRSKKE